MEHSLTRLGIDPSAEAKYLNSLNSPDRLSYLAKQLETHELHVVRNHVVSLPYNYWFSEGRIFTNEKKTTELDLDEKERGGLYKFGLKEAFTMAQNNPNQLVYQYSPPGPASFKLPPDPEYAKPYDIGQLYLMYFDGEKIKNISISINGDGEKWVAEIFGNKYFQMLNHESDIEKIKDFITTPILSQQTIDDFLNHNWQNPNRVVFTSNSLEKETKYITDDVLREIRNSLSGQLRGKINTELIAARALNGDKKVTKEDIERSYLLMIGQVMNTEGVSKTKFGGGCGGDVVRAADLFDQNPVAKLEALPNLSSGYRKLLGKKDSDENTWGYDFDSNGCRFCASQYVGPCRICESCTGRINNGEKLNSKN